MGARAKSEMSKCPFNCVPYKHDNGFESVGVMST